MGDVGERLYDPSSVRSRNEADRNDPDAAAAAACTFQPVVNKPHSTTASTTKRRSSLSGSSSDAVGPGVAAAPSAVLPVAPGTSAEGGAGAVPTAAATGVGGDAVGSNSGSAPAASGGGKLVFDRLFATKQTTDAKLAAARSAKHSSELEVSGATFRPDLSASKASAARALKGVGGANVDGGSSSASPAARSPSGGGGSGGTDAFSRLYNNAQQRLDKAAKLVPPELAECTFKPAITSSLKPRGQGVIGPDGGPTSESRESSRRRTQVRLLHFVDAACVESTRGAPAALLLLAPAVLLQSCPPPSSVLLLPLPTYPF